MNCWTGLGFAAFGRTCATPSSMPLGCLLFAYAARSLPLTSSSAGTRRLRDVWTRSSGTAIFPWVRVENLASNAVVGGASAGGRLAGARLPPRLVETFVDLSRFRGSCYRAANWQFLGETRGKGSVRTPKGVFVHPLDKDFQTLLRTGQRPAARHPTTTQGSANARVEPWRSLLDAVVTVGLRPAMAATSAFACSWCYSSSAWCFRKTGRGTGRPWPNCGTSAACWVAAAGVSGVALGDVQRPGQSRREPVSGLNAELLRRADATGSGPREGAGCSPWTAQAEPATAADQGRLPAAVGQRPLPPGPAQLPTGCVRGSRWILTWSPMATKGRPQDPICTRCRKTMWWCTTVATSRRRCFVSTSGPASGVPAGECQDSTETPRSRDRRQAGPGGAAHEAALGEVYGFGFTCWEPRCWTGTSRRTVRPLPRIEELYKVSKQMIGIEDFHGQSERGVKQAVRALCPDHMTRRICSGATGKLAIRRRW